jgi:hypothetical protein
MIAARLQSNIESRPVYVLTGALDGIDFSMLSPIVAVITLTNNSVLFNDDSAHHRIRAGLSQTLTG